LQWIFAHFMMTEGKKDCLPKYATGLVYMSSGKPTFKICTSSRFFYIF
jgi:hypothetical protein